ncbi:ATP-binding protein [Maledivibacter halophilus]|uniref:histidine kinase n=1 Tax=Maledivibacter halophilus TaxID=36842 RepID=A0A1T5MBB6_9FIRM|nr:ATP-binding protein [Maledivibacter halophilus]SKC85465.1 Sensor_kinase_SpoOB-type, alpha-helical domain [Maledivibacter halophilus]
MNSLLKFFNKNRALSIKLLFLFLVLIYMPMALYAHFVHIRTVDAVEKEKIDDIEQILIKTSQSVNFALDSIEKGVFEIVNHNGMQAGMENFTILTEFYKNKMSEFTERQVEILKSNVPYVDRVVFIDKNGTVILSDGNIMVNSDKFYQSDSFKKLLFSNSNFLWEYGFSEYISLQPNNEKRLMLIYRIKDLKGIEDVGYCFITINPNSFKALYDNTNIGNTGGVVILDGNDNGVLSKESFNIPEKTVDYILQEKSFYKMNNLDISGKEYYIGVAPLFPIDWFLVATVPREELTKTVEENLKSNFTPIIYIGISTALIIVIETFILSKVVTEKEMANYRLVLSEKMNEKLRVYKHDFTNHLQIIWGLMELKHYDKALDYLMKASNEGIVIKEKYEIGVPEIESTIFSTLLKAREKDIEIEMDCIKLESNLPIKIYDLTKILSNLLKNAMYALEKANGCEKKLKIKIYEELGFYVFEIINNVPIIPRELREKIFEKGFTTKGKEGSGLGLHIVRKMVEKNKGSIELKIDKEGNHFIVRFPA